MNENKTALKHSFNPIGVTSAKEGDIYLRIHLQRPEIECHILDQEQAEAVVAAGKKAVANGNSASQRGSRIVLRGTPEAVCLPEYFILYALSHQGSRAIRNEAFNFGSGFMVNRENILKLEIKTPTIEEQKELLAYTGTVLKNFNNLVDSEARKVELLRQAANGLTDALITGKTTIRENAQLVGQFMRSGRPASDASPETITPDSEEAASSEPSSKPRSP